MKKILYGIALFAAMGVALDANAQLIDESNVTITMDLQPILQLNMTGPTNIDFVFDQISEYVGGITRYGATSLKVSASVSWDLYAVGYSTTVDAQGVPIWDQQATYGGADTNAIDSISCHALELHQDKINPSFANATGGLVYDYSSPFLVTTTLGTNSIYASATPYTHPTASDKYIAGHASNADCVVGGSYLMTSTGGASSSYYYTIDYRIRPGLPAKFPNSGSNASPSIYDGLGVGITAGDAHYAQPGIYTMNVKYVLMENGN